jgi:3-keto-5-aminohexanoate cleavage enzyme
MTALPMLIAVAPNGARRTKADHQAVPITPLELAHTAAACAEAGAGMIHLHVRDDRGRHTLAPQFYQPALREVLAAVGEKMLIQVSSEAAGAYTTRSQIELMRTLAPHCLSCGLREFVADQSSFTQAAAFFKDLTANGTLIQYILYSPDDVRWYETVCDLGVIPGDRHFLLFVLGRYGSPLGRPEQLEEYIAALRRKSNWMICAFGELEHEVTQRAAALGGHARVGFENNLHLPSGSIAPDNSALVASAVRSALLSGRAPGGKDFATDLY